MKESTKHKGKRARIELYTLKDSGPKIIPSRRGQSIAKPVASNRIHDASPQPTLSYDVANCLGVDGPPSDVPKTSSAKTKKANFRLSFN